MDPSQSYINRQRQARSKKALTLVAVPDRVKIHVVLVVREEQEAEPGVKGVDGNYEEDPDDVSLLSWGAVETQVHVDLQHTEIHSEYFYR